MSIPCVVFRFRFVMNEFKSDLLGNITLAALSRDCQLTIYHLTFHM